MELTLMKNARAVLAAVLVSSLSLPASARADLWELLGELAKGIASAAKKFPEVYRVQLTVKTSSARGAGTDDAVSVELGSDRLTWINHPGDDREGGNVHTYDLLFFDQDFKNPLKKLDDIEYLEISKVGKDDWQVVWLELLVNGQRVYREDFPKTLKYLSTAPAVVEAVGGVGCRRRGG
jgi:hypothetical protein